MAIFEWIEGWYNTHRRHSALGYLSPVNYERKLLIIETVEIWTTTRPRKRGKSKPYQFRQDAQDCTVRADCLTLRIRHPQHQRRFQTASAKSRHSENTNLSMNFTNSGSKALCPRRRQVESMYGFSFTTRLQSSIGTLFRSSKPRLYSPTTYSHLV